MRNAGAASDPLKPYAARLMRCFPVSTRSIMLQMMMGKAADAEPAEIQDRPLWQAECDAIQMSAAGPERLTELKAPYTQRMED
jgi:hypothetical protein